MEETYIGIISGKEEDICKSENTILAFPFVQDEIVFLILEYSTNSTNIYHFLS
jgi:hypothetical protein